MARRRAGGLDPGGRNAICDGGPYLNAMPLILAIEPDRVRATYLATVVQERIEAELLIVESVDAALVAMQMRVPDVLLSSARLTPDDSTLSARLRTLNNKGMGPQMLVTPTLSMGERVQAVFAMQVNELLTRAVARRLTSAPGVWTGAPAQAQSPVERHPEQGAASARPVRDEWGLYDPEQCGFSALLERVRQLNDSQRKTEE